jgi:hypothetical protein
MLAGGRVERREKMQKERSKIENGPDGADCACIDACAFSGDSGMCCGHCPECSELEFDDSDDARWEDQDRGLDD